MSRKTLSLAAAAFFLSATAYAATAAEFDLDGAKALFNSKCSMCHGVDRPMGKQKDKAGWEETVTRMKGKAAGAITEADAKTIIEYLSRTQGTK